MQIIIDLDGTICSEERTYSRCLAKPKANAVESVNELYDAGHTIIIYSARTWVEYEMTVNWLSENGVKYHQLMMGKPVGDYWIDDRAINFHDNWDEIRSKLLRK
jgi:histidinol phosphatase-like enzyme